MEVEINKRTVTVDAETVPTLAALLKAERLDGPAHAGSALAVGGDTATRRDENYRNTRRMRRITSGI